MEDQLARAERGDRAVLVQDEVEFHGLVGIAVGTRGKGIARALRGLGGVGAGHAAGIAGDLDRRKLGSLGQETAEVLRILGTEVLGIGSGERGDLLDKGGIGRSGHILARGVVNGDAAERGAHGEAVLLTTDEPGKAAAVCGLEAAEDVALAGKLFRLGDAGLVDKTRVDQRDQFIEKLGIALLRRGEETVVDQRVEAVVNGGADRGGREGHARDELHARKGGVLSGEALGEFLAELLVVRVLLDGEIDDLARKVDREQELDRQLGIALGGLETQEVGLLRRIAVDALDGVGRHREGGGRRVRTVVQQLAVAEQGLFRLGRSLGGETLVLRHDGGGEAVDAPDARAEQGQQQHQAQDGS